MSATQLSALDEAFLALETPTAHMHVGWAALFKPPREGPRPSFEELRDHIAERLRRAPRYRQKVSEAPLDIDTPMWVDDAQFDIERHVRRSRFSDLDRVAAERMSRQLDRDRPLWEICIADQLEGGQIGVIGKAHHCMVDGIAAVELASLLLDPVPEPPGLGEDRWRPAPAPEAIDRVAGGLRRKVANQLELARLAAGSVRSPRMLLDAPRSAVSAVATLRRSLRGAEPVSPLNEAISDRRHVARVARPFDDLQRIKRRFGTTINDVYLAVAAGAVRRLLIKRGQDPVPLKVMVPVNLRDDGERSDLGNRISFIFVDLPCDEPEAERRLRRVHAATRDAKEGGEPRLGELALRAVSYAPRAIQRRVSQLMASPRMFNLVVSNIPGLREPMFMRGCELTEAYPVVPLAMEHALSIGMTTIQDRACFGLYADRQSLGDVDEVGEALDGAAEELLALC